MTTTSPGAAGGRGAAAAPALPAGHDRCTCTHLASEHDIGTRRGVKVRTACSRGTCDCRTCRPDEPRQTEIEPKEVD